ncbi:nuclear transport factor 2 family protein [Gemmata sp. G18]|uniref:Nuclear transport factor 2 family protein n=1 Tax=Gemmata palustris TaxID=2822762 RepID=A0ABS5BLS7_9BACT|nr:nuclear transport factor 2 family protein [Gemmata palustris]MBP3954669.1 nuclear transport factor 2 family protein [Gemmata palustris]
MSTSPSALATELAFRAKFLRIACLANIVLFVLLVGGGTALITTVARATGASTAAGDEKDIRAVLDAQVIAWNKGDLDGFMAGYWNDDQLTFISGGDITTGWKKTKERYEKRYKADGKEMGKLVFSDLHVETFSPNAAMMRGKFELTFEKEKDDAKKTARGRFTLILRKTPDGWKIVHDHTSAEEKK